MIKLSKCCVIFPLRPGCVAIGVIFTVLSLMSAVNKLIEITLFVKTARTSGFDYSYEDTRLSNYLEGKVIRCTVVMLMELLICSSAVAFCYGIVKERLRFLPPFIVHLALKGGFYLVHYFDMGTRYVEKNDGTGAVRVYIFGVIITGIFAYLWLCAYSAFLELKAKKDFQYVAAGIINRPGMNVHV